MHVHMPSELRYSSCQTISLCLRRERKTLHLLRRRFLISVSAWQQSAILNHRGSTLGEAHKNKLIERINDGFAAATEEREAVYRTLLKCLC